MQREIKKKTCIYGVVAAILAVALATTVTASLYPLIEEIIYRPSESTNQEPNTFIWPDASQEPLLVSVDELLNNPSNYNSRRITVTGKVSQLGHFRGFFFMLDERILVSYYNPQQGTFVDISNIKNGDTVTVTGVFGTPNTIYAENIQKA